MPAARGFKTGPAAARNPGGSPDLGFLIAYEAPEALEGWAAGVVKAIEDGWDGRYFTVDTRAGTRTVPREQVFYWWPSEREAPSV